MICGSCGASNADAARFCMGAARNFQRRRLSKRPRPALSSHPPLLRVLLRSRPHPQARFPWSAALEPGWATA